MSVTAGSFSYNSELGTGTNGVGYMGASVAGFRYNLWGGGADPQVLDSNFQFTTKTGGFGPDYYYYDLQYLGSLASVTLTFEATSYSNFQAISNTVTVLKNNTGTSLIAPLTLQGADPNVGVRVESMSSIVFTTQLAQNDTIRFVFANANSDIMIDFTTFSYTLELAPPPPQQPQMVYSQNAQFQTDQLAIMDTTPGSVTSGALIVSGGINAKDTYVSGHVAVNAVKITPNLNDIVFEQQYTLNNDVSAWTNISGLSFDDTKASTIKSQIWVVADGKHALYQINAVNLGNGWTMSSCFTGDITNVYFNIFSEGGYGYLQYKNANSSGTTKIRVRAMTNAPLDSSPF